MEIEKVAAEDAGQDSHASRINPLVGVQPYQARELAFGLGLGRRSDQAVRRHHCSGSDGMFVRTDLVLVEINPLVVTADGDLLAWTRKINVDDNALYRQPELVAMRDAAQEDETRDTRAANGT